jgi:preprotein translocase SecE subunit
VARDRQRAKQRQQARREARLADRGERPPGSPPDDGGDGAEARATDGAPAAERGNDRIDEHELEELADLEVGAPPEDVGFSERVIDHPSRAPDFDDDDALEEELAEEAGATGPARERQARKRAETSGRPRVIAFLENVWAELKRVQWPDRKTLTQLTGVVLVFVIIMGAYLGALDAVFSELIKKIL